jgi:aryl-alcohol dehydrogenase-like predicted oxidoreductase
MDAGTLPRRTLGAGGPEVGAIGLGCMGMSWGYAEGTRDDGESAAVLPAALDSGVTLVDTAAVYGDGHNEELVGRGLAGRREEAVLATKGGLVVDDLTTRAMHRDGSPAALRAGVEASLRRLGTDVVDLYYLHRIDDAVPLAESWGALSEIVAQGHVRALGLSEVTAEQAATAHAVHPVAAVQSELSLWTRDAQGAGGGDDVVSWCAAHGAAFVPFAPLGRGFLSGTITAASDFEDGDFRAGNARFAPASRAANLRIVEVVRTVAARHGATPAQVSLAWVLAQGPHVVPIPGTRRRTHLAENAAAAGLALSEQDLAELTAVPAAVGTRY